MLLEFSVIGQIFQYLGQRHNTHHRHGEIALDFLDRRQLALAALIADVDQLLATTPERARPVVIGALPSLSMARAILATV